MDADPNARLNAALANLLQEVQSLRRTVRQEQRRLLLSWQTCLKRREFVSGAENLAAYIALRRHDLRELQVKLATFGLSSLGRSEGRVLPTLDTLLQALKLMLGTPADTAKSHRLALSMDHRPELMQNTTQLLGSSPAKRDVRIMVTLPALAATDSDVARHGLRAHQLCAR